MIARRREIDELTADERLLARLRQLALVEPDALLFGAAEPQRGRLVRAHAEEIAEALGCARARMAELVASIAGGPDPLGVVAAAPAVRARGGAEGGSRLAARLLERAEAARALARLDEACARLLPRLLDLDRRAG